MESVIISPEKEKLKEIGQQLLELADNPSQVQWVTWPKAGYSIPLELFMRFDAFDSNGVPVLDEVVQEPEPKRRRRRNKESTDNNDPSEEE